MVKIGDFEPAMLKDAIILWTGWRRESMPSRKDSILEERFGADVASKLLATINSLESDFYESDARLTAVDLEEMGRISAEQFRKKHPELSDEIALALAWCYTFDYK